MDFDVAVLGSLHLDIVVSGGRLPRPDETAMAESWRFKCGGKGGNQAVAAARFGARTVMGGRVGGDSFGDQLLANLKVEHVDSRAVVAERARCSGMSVAIEELEGDYGAVVVSGVNRLVTGAEFDGIAARVLVLQNEIPHAANVAAARRFKAGGNYVIHNAAPARKPHLDEVADLIVVNRVEAEAIAGMSVETLDDALRAAAALRTVARDAIVTAGKLGYALASRNGESKICSSLSVAAGSAHGAGDCFVGALAARIALGDGLSRAARFAGVAAGLAVSGRTGLTANDVEAVLRRSS
jgi:ribokinase